MLKKKGFETHGCRIGVVSADGLRRVDQIFAVGGLDSARCQDDLLGGLLPEQRHDGFADPEFDADRRSRGHVLRAARELMQVDEGGDFAFEGEITNYTSTTARLSSDDYALLNRPGRDHRQRCASTTPLDEKACVQQDLLRSMRTTSRRNC